MPKKGNESQYDDKSLIGGLKYKRKKAEAAKEEKPSPKKGGKNDMILAHADPERIGAFLRGELPNDGFVADLLREVRTTGFKFKV